MKDDLDLVLRYFESKESAATNPAAGSDRFATLSTDEIQGKLDAAIPPNTRRKELWAVRIFDQWFEQRHNRILHGDTTGLLVLKERHEWNACDWNYLLKMFILEVRKVDGTKYNATTLRDIFSMMQHYLQYTLKKELNLWKDAACRDARMALDAAMKEATREGLVPGTNASSPIPATLEEELWQKGRLATTSPKLLLFTLVFYLGKQFALRGGTELHGLRYSCEIQLQHEDGQELLVYCENRATKTNNAGIKRRFVPLKTVKASHTADHDRCLPCIYKLYVDKRPENCTVQNLFLAWMRSDASIQQGRWYQNAPVGRHSLDGIVRELTAPLTGVTQRYTNQSLRKTCASTLHRAGFAREDIARVTGHSSTAIERYIQFDVQDHVKVSHALQSGGQSSSLSIDTEPERSVEAMEQSNVVTANPAKKMRLNINGNTNTVEIVFE
ncbi:hypothetical protein BOX15_Mlig005367g15 [Macrostomum lignano]|uniref:ZMYM2-like/QRICH1 C-terminal domain-containing protein n=1 Tax=Macrostomum lignano TaxID=282301 RepID=A0A267GJ33_9PLAT|nr:hypothetical protein BOX15_Mlig005367g15 [Macrostomum lignano]